eukprot:9024590-Pyramimonas_sp.AAC.1
MEIARGARQGDPASTVLCCMGMFPPQMYISKNCWECLDLQLESADDCLYGMRNATMRLARLFQVIQSHEAAVGLALDIHKCLILVHSAAFQARRLRQHVAQRVAELIQDQVVHSRKYLGMMIGCSAH